MSTMKCFLPANGLFAVALIALSCSVMIMIFSFGMWFERGGGGGGGGGAAHDGNGVSTVTTPAAVLTMGGTKFLKTSSFGESFSNSSSLISMEENHNDIVALQKNVSWIQEQQVMLQQREQDSVMKHLISNLSSLQLRLEEDEEKASHQHQIILNLSEKLSFLTDSLLRKNESNDQQQDKPQPRFSKFEMVEKSNSPIQQMTKVQIPTHICTFHQNVHDQHMLVIGGRHCESSSLGNMLSNIYISALYAFDRNNTFEVGCKGSVGIQSKYFANKIWSMRAAAAAADLNATTPRICALCNTFPHTCRTGLNYAVPMIRETLRLVPAPAEMDDITIHVRCGDVLQYPHHTEYGYPKYESYKEFLLPLLMQHNDNDNDNNNDNNDRGTSSMDQSSSRSNIRSIGIVTASMNAAEGRAADADFVDTCTILYHDLVSYLQTDVVPNNNNNNNNNITVHLRSSDTVEESIGRMVHSKYLWCNPSTFCLYPVLASTGIQAYIVKSSGLYPFVEEIQETDDDDDDDEPSISRRKPFIIVDRPFLNMNQIVTNHMTANDMIQWMRSKN